LKIVIKFASIIGRIVHRFSLLILIIDILKALSVSYAIVKRKTTFYPNFVVEFERDFAKYTGRRLGVSFCNGTSAIEAALFAIDIGPGDEVLVPSFTFHATFTPIISLGAKPIFIDTNPETLEINLEDALKKINKKSKAMIVVHLFGRISNIDKIQEFVKKTDLKLIEDASHAHGAQWEGKSSGSFGDIGCFSLQGSKPISAGEGGICVCDSSLYYKRMIFFGHFNRDQKKRDLDAGYGQKRRANPLGIAMAKIDLKFINKINNKKQNKNKILDGIFSESINLHSIRIHEKERPGGFFGGYPLIINNSVKDKLIKLLKEFNIGYVSEVYPEHYKNLMFINEDYRKIILETYGYDKLKDNPKLLNFEDTKRKELLGCSQLCQTLILLDARYLYTITVFDKIALMAFVRESNKL
jgi:dTDP-4-amino-4,6-dideoxygalactose transaminase